jgi:hypothetical protein
MNIIESFEILKISIVPNTDNVALVHWKRTLRDQDTGLESLSVGETITEGKEGEVYIPLESITDSDIRGWVMDAEGNNWQAMKDHMLSDIAYKVKKSTYVTHQVRDGYVETFGAEVQNA